MDVDVNVLSNRLKESRRERRLHVATWNLSVSMFPHDCRHANNIIL